MTNAQTVQSLTRTALILNHIKENNVSYLVGMLVLHTMGVLSPVIDKAQGVCM